MNRDEIREREYRGYVRELNRQPPPDDEHGALAAYDAVTRAYGLDRYTAPHKGKGRPKAATAAHTGGVFCPLEVIRHAGSRPRASGASAGA